MVPSISFLCGPETQLKIAVYTFCKCHNLWRIGDAPTARVNGPSTQVLPAVVDGEQEGLSLHQLHFFTCPTLRDVMEAICSWAVAFGPGVDDKLLTRHAHAGQVPNTTKTPHNSLKLTHAADGQYQLIDEQATTSDAPEEDTFTTATAHYIEKSKGKPRQGIVPAAAGTRLVGLGGGADLPHAAAPIAQLSRRSTSSWRRATRSSCTTRLQPTFWQRWAETPSLLRAVSPQSCGAHLDVLSTPPLLL